MMNFNQAVEQIIDAARDENLDQYEAALLNAYDVAAEAGADDLAEAIEALPMNVEATNFWAEIIAQARQIIGVMV